MISSQLNPRFIDNYFNDYNKLLLSGEKPVGVKFPQIYLTEGVSGVIKSLIETLTLPGKNKIIFPFPTFELYPVYCKMFDVEAMAVSYTNGYDWEFSIFIKLIDDSTAIVL